LKAGEWFRRGRLFMVSPVRGDYRRCQAETPLIDLFKLADPALIEATAWSFSAYRRLADFVTTDEWKAML
jgi:hypothetical protein